MNDIEVTVYDVNYLPDYVEAEEERQANELVRIANETTRQANEATRVSNETTRGTNETSRISAESGRVTAEQGRVSAEAIRVSNENARIAAEEAREAVINSLADVATSGKSSDLTNDAGFIDKDVNDLTYYTLATDTGSTIDLSINSSTYVVTLALKNAAGTTISSDTIDLPLESVVVGGSYDSTNKKVVLTLQNGSTIEFSVADLVAGLQSEITSSNKLSSDLVDDTNNTNKFVTASDKTNWNAKVGTTDYANSSTGGAIKTGNGLQVWSNSGVPYASEITYANYGSQGANTFIGKGTLENVITGKDLTTKSYVDDLVGDLETILETLDTGSGVNGN